MIIFFITRDWWVETGVPGGKPPESVIEGGQSMPEKKRSKLEDMINKNKFVLDSDIITETQWAKMRIKVPI